MFSQYSFAISTITEIELLGKFNIAENEKKIIRQMLDGCLLLEVVTILEIQQLN